MPDAATFVCETTESTRSGAVACGIEFAAATQFIAESFPAKYAPPAKIATTTVPANRQLAIWPRPNTSS